MKWEEVKEGDLLEFEGTAPKKYKINQKDCCHKT